MANLKVVQPKALSPIAALVDDFLAARRTEGRSLRTIGWYEDTLRRELLPWCASEGITDTAQLTPALLGRYTTRLLDQGGARGPLSRATVRSYVKAIRGFLSWAADPEGGGVTVGAKPKLPQESHKVVDTLSREEILRMETVAKAERDKLLVRVLADTGIRLGELLGLRIQDIVEPRRGEYALKVHGKGDRERLVPLAPALHRRLRRYLAAREVEGHDPVFVALRKGPDGRYPPAGKSGVEQAIRVLGQEAAIEKRVHPHTFRHSFATEWLRRGGNIISLQHVLGHADLTMIQSVYSHLDSSDDYKAAMAVLLGSGPN